MTPVSDTLLTKEDSNGPEVNLHDAGAARSPMERFYVIIYSLMIVAGGKLLLDGFGIA